MNPNSQPALPRLFSLGLSQRFALFAFLFAIEWVPASNLVHKGLGAGFLLHLAVVFTSLFLALGYVRNKFSFQETSRRLETVPIGWGLLLGHVAAFFVFVFCSFLPLESGASDVSTYAITAAWCVSGLLAIALAGCALLPPSTTLPLVRSTGHTWIYALGAGLIIGRLTTYFHFWNGTVWDPSVRLYWPPAMNLTFFLVKTFLHPFLSNMAADKATMTIGTPQFSIIILPWCAGFEGMALMLVFSSSWLLFFRREFRFPQSLLLIPAGMVVMWLSNAIRITILILIGVAGAPGVALGGFHSQAGWIAFNCVALGFALYTRQMPWFAARSTDKNKEHNPTAAYLMPFLVILAAGMLSHAVAGEFEWLYPLRFAAGAVTLWLFRARYRELDWRFGWISIVTGIAVFGIWLGLDLLVPSGNHNGIESGLASSSGTFRIFWLVFRTAAAVITVPLAEELVFRGFLIRRLISSDFESLDFRRFTTSSVVLSSMAFGLLHGDRWIAGTLAGLLYAAAFLRQGRIGDAVAAHATTNVLIAVWVLLGGKWYLW